MTRDHRERAGRWLVRARKSAGYDTTTDLARAIDVHQGTVSAYETGKTSIPEERVDDLARALHLPVIDVRRGLGLWVPDELTPRLVSPEEAIAADTTISDGNRRILLAVLAAMRAEPEGAARAIAPDTFDPVR